MATSGLLRGWTAASAGQEGRALAPPTVRLELGPARAARWLALATAAVVGSCVLVTSLSIVLGRRSLFGLGPTFDLNREASVPAGYSALLLLAAAGYLLGDRHQEVGAYLDPASNAVLALLVLGYLYRVATFRRRGAP